MGQMLDRNLYGHCYFIALNLFSNVANFNLEFFFNIQLYTERLQKFIHTEKYPNGTKEVSQFMD
jgi:hypothetical protein